MRPGKRRSAYLLHEATVWMAGLIAAMLFAGPLLFGVMRMKYTSELASRQLLMHKNLADGFRRDVNGCRTAPDRIRIDGEEFVASENCLLLKRPDGGEVVYRWKNNALERIENAGFETFTWNVPIDPEVIALQLIQSKGEPSLISLRLILQKDPGQPKRPVEIQALLGGDL